MNKLHSAPKTATSSSWSNQWRLVFKLASRHLRRDLRRTAIATSAVSLGLTLFIFTYHLQQGSYQALIRTGVATQAGHLVIQAHGYQKRPDQKRYLSGVSHLQTQLIQALETAQIEAKLTARASVAGLLRSSNETTRIKLLAIDPRREANISDWRERLASAPRPEGETGGPLPSSWLSIDDERGIILGAQLAKRLDLTVGDKLVYTYQHRGEVENLLFRVRGVLKLASSEQEAHTALITLRGFSAAFKAPDIAHQLTIHLTDLDQLSAAHQVVHQVLSDHKLLSMSATPNLSETEPTPNVSSSSSASDLTSSNALTSPAKTLELLRWQEALPTLYQFSLKDQQASLVIFLIMGIIIAIGILNTIAMSALERRRYFGIMMALGLTPRLIMGVLTAEGLVMGVFASLLGCLLGLAASWPAVHYGLDLSQLMGENMEIEGVVLDATVYSVWSPEGVVYFTLTSIFLCTLASFYPAWRTARISALVAMRGPDAQ